MHLKKLITTTILSALLYTSVSAMEQDAQNHNQANSEKQEIYVAIIIDDFGNGTKDVEEMMALPIPFTGAVIPGQPHSYAQAQVLKDLGHGVIVHLPMQAKGNNKSWQTPLAISLNLSADEITSRTQKAIDELHQATGLNNHMGSVATADKAAMESVIDTVHGNNLIMIDSVTTNKSKMKEVCEELGINYLKRDVFLDDGKNTQAFVEKRMKETLQVAQKQGYAIAIGHVGPSGGFNTVNGIKSMIQTLESEGVRFVTIDELYNILYA